jgi:three-Cys-motif partner protein
MAKSTPLDEIGYWSELKLEILRKYASAYSTILASNSAIKRYVYIDAFAGAGKHRSRTTGDLVAGSPTNALKITPAFSEYHFIDLNPGRVSQLQEIAEGRNDVHVHQGDCNQILLETVFPRCRWGEFARGLCILDPYNLGVKWEVMETAGKMKSIEVFYNFAIMDANMNVLLRDPDRAPPDQLARLDRVFGGRAPWRDAAYVRQPGLFGDMEEKATNDAVITAFLTRLRSVAGFAYVSEALPMRNRVGCVVYYLIFASGNSTGAKIVKQIFDKYRAAEGG